MVFSERSSGSPSRYGVRACDPMRLAMHRGACPYSLQVRGICLFGRVLSRWLCIASARTPTDKQTHVSDCRIFKLRYSHCPPCQSARANL